MLQPCQLMCLFSTTKPRGRSHFLTRTIAKDRDCCAQPEALIRSHWKLLPFSAYIAIQGVHLKEQPGQHTSMP